MIPDAEFYTSKAKDFLASIEIQNNKIIQVKENIDSAILNMNSIRALTSKKLKDDGLPIGLMKTSIDGDKDVLEELRKLQEAERDYEALKATIKWLYAKYDLTKKCLAQIQVETQRLGVD